MRDVLYEMKKRGLIPDTLVPLLILLALLIVMLGAYVYLRAKGINALDYFRNLVRLR